LNEISSVVPANDSRASGPRISAAFDVAPGLNPASANIPIARRGGIAYAISAPGYSSQDPGRVLPFAGQAAVISLDGASAPVVRRVAMVLDFGEDGAARSGGSRGAARALIESYFDDVQTWRRNREAYERGEMRELSLSRSDMQALVPALAGEQRLLIGVSRASDIRQVLDLARERRLRIILTGAEEGWMVADEIAAAGVPVILNPTANLPTSYETLGATLRNAARLHAAGVRIAFTGNDETFRVRELRYNAGIAVAHGLPYAAAIEAITVNPAVIFGLDDRIGSIAPGKLASLVLWSGDPLEPMSQAEMMFIDGREQELDNNRPARLRDKYIGRAQGMGDTGQ
jgi:imidazolonepropionase-like amidohydrolase